MLSILRNIIVLCLICISPYVFSQGSKINHFNSGNIEFKYIYNPGKKDINTDHILKTLASGQGSDLENTSFKFFYTVNIELIQDEHAQISGYIRFKGFVITGDVKYKSFSTTDVLIPSGADVVVKIFINSENIKNIKLENIQVIEPTTVAVFSIPDSLLSTNFSVEANIQKFYFSEKYTSLFDSRISDINTYYTSDSILESAEAKLQKIDPENVDLIPLYNIWFDEVREATGKLKSLELSNKLELDLHDPIKYVTRLNLIESKVASLYSQLKRDIEQLEIIYLEKAKELIKQNKAGEAEEYLRKSLKFNTRYIPAHYELAKLHLKKDNPDESVKIISKVLLTLEINDPERKMLIELSDEIIQYYLKTAEAFILQDNDNEALEELSKAESFCKDIQGLNCPEEIDELTARAKYGIFKSFLQVATKAMAIESHDFSEIYIQKAAEYQQNNKEAINSDAEITKLYGKLIYQCTEKGFEALSVADFNKAQNYFDRAYRLCNFLEDFKCSQRLVDGINAANQGIAMEYDTGEKTDYTNYEIENTISEKTDHTQKKPAQIYDRNDYNRLIAEGQILMETHHLNDAFEKFIEAKNIEKKIYSAFK